jgi:hypothetical protein
MATFQLLRILSQHIFASLPSFGCEFSGATGKVLVAEFCFPLVAAI